MKRDDKTPNTLREQLEARIIALLLHELDPEEAAEIKRLTRNDPVLSQFHRRMKKTMGLVEEAEGPDTAPAPDDSAAPAQLDPSRRRKLLDHFQTQAPLPEPEKPAPPRIIKVPLWPQWFPRPLRVAVATLLIAGVAAMIVIPNFVKLRSAASRDTMAMFETKLARTAPGHGDPGTGGRTERSSSLGERYRHDSPPPPLEPPPARGQNRAGATRSKKGLDIFLPSDAQPAGTAPGSGNVQGLGQRLAGESRGGQAGASPDDSGLTPSDNLWSMSDTRHYFGADFESVGNAPDSFFSSSEAIVPEFSVGGFGGGGGAESSRGRMSGGRAISPATVTYFDGPFTQTADVGGGLGDLSEMQLADKEGATPPSFGFSTGVYRPGSAPLSYAWGEPSIPREFDADVPFVNGVGGVPYGVAVGNHDSLEGEDRAGVDSLGRASQESPVQGSQVADFSSAEFYQNFTLPDRNRDLMREDVNGTLEWNERDVALGGTTLFGDQVANGTTAGEALKAQVKDNRPEAGVRVLDNSETLDLSAGRKENEEPSVLAQEVASPAALTSPPAPAPKPQPKAEPVSQFKRPPAQPLTATRESVGKVLTVEGEVANGREAARKRLELKARQEQLSSLADGLSKLDREERTRAMATASMDEKLAEDVQALEETKEELEQLAQKLGPDHPKVEAVKQRVQAESSQVEGKVDALMAGLQEEDKKVTEQLRRSLAEEKPAQTRTFAKRKPIPEITEKEPPPPAPAPARPPSEPLPEVLTAVNRFSTFSLNVSDVSFKLAAASLDNGTMPDPGSIRSEEFINAMDYHDPAPAPGSKLALAWEQAGHPFAHNRDLMRFSVQTAAWGREAGRPLNLVLLLDNSGSMERADRVTIIQQALWVLARQLKPTDQVSVVAFARTARLWVDGLEGGRPEELVRAVGRLNPQGGTNLELALQLAYETAQKHFQPGANNRVILLTDGAANLGDVDPASLKQMVEDGRRRNIALDCFGIGWEGYNDDLLEVLSRNGDGRYGFINHPQEAASEFAAQLAGALQVAAANVKAQVEFNPDRVVSYRQIGYQKHQLTKEQFRDNTVDAAEIGAAESGTALYSIQVNPAGRGPLGVVRVRFKVPSSGLYEEREWPLPYTPKVPALDEAYPSMRLAGTAAFFAEWLAQSPFAGNVTLAALQQYLAGVSDTYPLDPQPRQLNTMIQQARRITGQ